MPQKSVSIEFFSSKLISNPLIEEVFDNSWVLYHTEKIDRKIFKQKYDFSKFYSKLSKILANPASTNIKVRQVYDKFYRWSTIKPEKGKKTEISCKREALIRKNSFNLESNDDTISENTRDLISSERTSLLRISTIHSSQTSKNSIVDLCAERIKVQGSYFGKVFLSHNFIEFICESLKKNKEIFPTGALEYTQILKSLRHL